MGWGGGVGRRISGGGLWHKAEVQNWELGFRAHMEHVLHVPPPASHRVPQSLSFSDLQDRGRVISFSPGYSEFPVC